MAAAMDTRARKSSSGDWPSTSAHLFARQRRADEEVSIRSALLPASDRAKQGTTIESARSQKHYYAESPNRGRFIDLFLIRFDDGAETCLYPSQIRIENV